MKNETTEADSERDRTGKWVPGIKCPSGKPFQKGNPGGPGNPLAAQTEQLRAALVKAVSKADIKKIAQQLVKSAKEGNVGAANEILNRLLGRASQSVTIENDNGRNVTTHNLQIVMANPELLAMMNTLARKVALEGPQPTEAEHRRARITATEVRTEAMPEKQPE